MQVKGSSINYVPRISWLFTPPPSLSQVVTFLRPPSYQVWRHIFCNLLNSCRLTKFPHVYELARHRIALSELWILNVITCILVKLFNMQCNCFNLVDTCKIALILFLKCAVTKFRIPPPLVTQCHTSSTSSAPLNMWCNLWMPPNLLVKMLKIIISRTLRDQTGKEIA